MAEKYTDQGPSGGELQSRSTVVADPREGIYISAVGQMQSILPAHKLGLSGSAWRYGDTLVGGTTNLLPIEDFLITIPYTGPGVFLGQYRDLVSFYTPNMIPTQRPLGGPSIQFVLGGLRPGDPFEAFTSAGTVSVVGNVVTGVGTAFLATTVPGYAYTPSLKNPQPGDFIRISNKDYLITHITSATQLEIYPAATFGAGTGYEIRRYGFHSASRTLTIQGWTYTVCNAEGPAAQSVLGLNRQRTGTICATTGGTFKTCPQTTAPLDIYADDIAYYKGFLLYGTDTSVSWSIAGFPSTLPFGATDFPATNITVVDATDEFVSFEYLGDQLVALFKNSMWLVTPTGTLPEFNFYKLPENRGPDYMGELASAGTGPNLILQGRITCSAAGAIYYISNNGIFEYTGSIGQKISDPVEDMISRLQIGVRPIFIDWDAGSDTIIVNCLLTSGTHRCLVYSRKTGTWSVIDGNSQSFKHVAPAYPIQEIGSSHLAFTKGGISQLNLYVSGTYALGSDIPTNAAVLPWIWASPVLNLSDTYTKWQFTGFSIDGHGDYNANDSLNWTIYSGQSPFLMNPEISGTYSYKKGTISSRDIIGSKIDKPYIGIVLSGTKYIKLSGIMAYDTRYQARR